MQRAFGQQLVVAVNEGCRFDELASLCGNFPVPACYGITWDDVDKVTADSKEMDKCIFDRLTTREQEKLPNTDVEFADLSTEAHASYDPNTQTFITTIDLVDFVLNDGPSLHELFSHEYAHHLLFDVEEGTPSGHTGRFGERFRASSGEPGAAIEPQYDERTLHQLRPHCGHCNRVDGFPCTVYFSGHIE